MANDWKEHIQCGRFPILICFAKCEFVRDPRAILAHVDVLLQLAIEERNIGNRLRWEMKRKWRSFEITKTLKSFAVTFESTFPCEEPQRVGAAYRMAIMIPKIQRTKRRIPFQKTSDWRPHLHKQDRRA
jgi:hypothetical protein